MSQHTGHELKRLRESKGLTLQQAAKDTCLRAGFLQELEECTSTDDLPGVYRKLSLRMYARYLGLEVPAIRCTPVREERVRIAPVGMFIRRMGRPLQNSRKEPAPRSPLFGLAKVTSAAVVVVLGLGLWSLNAKLSRLNIDDLPHRAERAAQATAAAPQEEEPAAPSELHTIIPPQQLDLDHSVLLTLLPSVPQEEICATEAAAETAGENLPDVVTDTTSDAADAAPQAE
ncbi:MAG: helix-turn-helix domain-containing protein [Chthoniobacterales bacterium]|nr:helix-turn-helix domain-containing protein [Chthoniobacterales bacterium]